MAPAQPLFQMWAAVNKTSILSTGKNEENRVPGIPVLEAFKAITINVSVHEI